MKRSHSIFHHFRKNHSTHRIPATLQSTHQRSQSSLSETRTSLAALAVELTPQEVRWLNLEGDAPD